MIGRLTVLTLVLFAPAGVLAAEAEGQWFFDVEASGAYNDNIGKANRKRDIVHDTSLLANIGVAYNQEFSTEQAVTLRAFAEFEEFENVNDISRKTFGGQLIYRWQSRLGFSAPFYQFNTTVRFNDAYVRQRDSLSYTSQLLVSKRLTDRILGSAGFEYRREESDSIVFDQKHARLFFNADYMPGTSWAFYSTYSFTHGDILSTAQVSFCNGGQANDTFTLLKFSEAVAPDEAFNNAYCGNWIAYRLNGNINSLVLGVNRGFGHRFSIDLSAARIVVNAIANDYDATTVNASFLVR
ncbi:MAG: hypothetical protein HKM98_08040, partial [Gammaproteobacteria bacterium]|nr:hypothetical protein [Gammaproteobacteria bacterium]